MRRARGLGPRGRGSIAFHSDQFKIIERRIEMNKIIKSLAIGAMLGSMVFSTLGCGQYEIVRKTEPMETTMPNQNSQAILTTKAFLKDAFGKNGSIDVDKENQLFIFTPYDENVISVALLAKENREAKQLWEDMVVLFEELSTTFYNDLPEYSLVFADPNEEDSFILCVWNGTTVYDVAED